MRVVVYDSYKTLAAGSLAHYCAICACTKMFTRTNCIVQLLMTEQDWCRVMSALHNNQSGKRLSDNGICGVYCDGIANSVSEQLCVCSKFLSDIRNDMCDPLSTSPVSGSRCSANEAIDITHCLHCSLCRVIQHLFWRNKIRQYSNCGQLMTLTYCVYCETYTVFRKTVPHLFLQYFWFLLTYFNHFYRYNQK